MPRPSPPTFRAIAVINYLAANPSESFTLSDLARRLKMSKATAHSILGTLTEAGYLLRNESDRTFSLGPALVAIGHAAVSPTGRLLDIARQEMEQLNKATGFKCFINSTSGDEVVTLAVAGGVGAPRVGDRQPLSAPLGAVHVAWASSDRVERWLRQVPRGQEREYYRRVLETIRSRGFALSIEVDARVRLVDSLGRLGERPSAPELQRLIRSLVQELALEDSGVVDLDPNTRYRIRYMAAPIFDAQQNVRLDMLLGDFPEMNGNQLRSYADLLTGATRRVTQMIGGLAPNH